MGTSPDRIRAEIEATRDELARDLDQLAERASPRRAAHRRAERLRGAVSDARDRVRGNGSSPDGQSSAQQRAQDTAHQAQERAQHAAQSVRESTGHAAERMSDTAGQAGDAMRRAPHEATERTESNPMIAGMIAFGAGMLAASMVRSSPAEQKAAGRLTDRVGEIAGPVREAATAEARESAQHMKEDGAQFARHAAQRVKEVATEAAQSHGDGQRSGERQAGHFPK